MSVSLEREEEAEDAMDTGADDSSFLSLPKEVRPES